MKNSTNKFWLQKEPYIIAKEERNEDKSNKRVRIRKGKKVKCPDCP